MGDADGVLVPAELCRPLLRLLVLGAAEQSRRDGGLVLAPGLVSLLSALDSSARGTAPASIGTGSWLRAGEAGQLIGVSARMARRLASRGQLVARKTARGDWEIDRQAAENYRRQRVG